MSVRKPLRRRLNYFSLRVAATSSSSFRHAATSAEKFTGASVTGASFSSKLQIRPWKNKSGATISLLYTVLHSQNRLMQTRWMLLKRGVRERVWMIIYILYLEGSRWFVYQVSFIAHGHRVTYDSNFLSGLLKKCFLHLDKNLTNWNNCNYIQTWRPFSAVSILVSLFCLGLAWCMLI